MGHALTSVYLSFQRDAANTWTLGGSAFSIVSSTEKKALLQTACLTMPKLPTLLGPGPGAALANSSLVSVKGVSEVGNTGARSSNSSDTAIR